MLSLIVLAVSVAVVTSNYLAIAYSFYPLRYDGQPLSQETFVGSLFRAIAPEATSRSSMPLESRSASRLDPS